MVRFKKSFLLTCLIVCLMVVFSLPGVLDTAARRGYYTPSGWTLAGNIGTNATTKELTVDTSDPDLPEILPTSINVGLDPLLSIPENISAYRGSPITVPILIDDVTGLQGADIDLQYDTNVFDLSNSDLRLGSLTGGSGWGKATNVDDSTGLIRLAIYGINPPSGGSGSLAELEFFVRADAVLGTTIIDFLSSCSLNEGGLVLTLQDGQLLIAPAPPEAVDDLVSVSTGLVRYDRRTGQFSVNVTVTNTSDTAIGSPVWLVIEGISSPEVTVANADGTTADGKPYIDSSALLGDGQLDPGESLIMRIYFTNPFRVRFTWELSVRGMILP